MSLALIGLAVGAVVLGAPLVGWPGVVRLPAVLVPALILAVVVLRPWRWSASEWRALEEWTPSARVVCTGALVVGLLLFWLVLTRFRSGEINAVDFTVYFDRPCFQTTQGRPLFIETADFPELSQGGGLRHHAYWGMFPVCYLYALHATPLWLLALSVIAVTAGAVHVLRAMQRLGTGGVLATATAIAFVLNDNTARTLNYGFHPEVLYAWFIPWLLDAALRGNRRQFVAATLACILVKEDAAMPLFAASVALGLIEFRRMNHLDRAVFLVLPVILALANLGIYYAVVVPALTTEGLPAYGHFWVSYGPTPMRALVGMIAHPWAVLLASLRSGFFRTVILPHLFLPVLGWRWTLGIVPIVALYSASDDPQLRLFGIYYSIPLVPFLVLGASTGALMLARRVATDIGRAALSAATLILLGALLVGSGSRGYSLRPWRTEIAAVPDALSRLAGERVVLVQSGLYPHAGYDERTQLLTPETLHNPRYAGAAVLIARRIGAYPFRADDLDSLHRLPSIQAMPGGLIAVRRPVTQAHR
ncbi:MAG: DUF2079 domain-containing protein [Acidobacteria bacterium]|nr:DUF2079 domain-containing protein [Acidobacteriota bacterium]